MPNMSLKAICENKILPKISESKVSRVAISLVFGRIIQQFNREGHEETR